MSYFRDAEVRYGELVFCFSAEEGRTLEGSVNYWHRPGDPSTWLATDVFLAARRKVWQEDEHLPQQVALELAAAAMDITVEKLRSLIEWHEQYMRWHDGDSDYRVLEEE